MTTVLKLEMTDADADRIKALQAKMEVNSPAPVVTNALKLFEDVIKQADQGNKLYMKNAAGELTEYEVF